MRRLKQAVLAAAVIAAFAAAPSYGQTGTANVWSGSIPAPAASARVDERASAVIRVIDAPERTVRSGSSGTGSVAIDTVELARARASGEIQVSEGTSAHVLERIRPRAGDSAIVNAKDEARTPTRQEMQATAKFDDVSRSREHARYEADKRRRDTDQAREMQARAMEIQRARASGETRAQIAWSAPEQPIVRVNPPASSLDADVTAGASGGIAVGGETE